MDLAPPPVGELYVSHEELIVAANTWLELTVTRSISSVQAKIREESRINFG